MPARSRVAVTTALGVAVALSPLAAAAAPATDQPAASVPSEQSLAVGPATGGVLELDPRKLAALPLEPAAPRAGRLRAAAATGPTPPVGTVRQWYALDIAKGSFTLDDFTLRAVSAHSEIWVANDTAFQPGDCRNPRTTVTTEQAEQFAHEFDTNILPTESRAFSTAPDRDGSHALNDGGGTRWAGDGARTVTLVDNIRDDAYYDLDNASNKPYVAGYFSDSIDDATDRNVMTVDAWDWLHRTGANPPDAPVPGDNCASAPARPRLYESTFAHEYQHLLESYQDAFEETWLNEGLSDLARSLTGYVDGRKQVTQIGFDSHLQCFLGNLRTATPANASPRAGCGPENSLTQWQDQPGGEVLGDYGAAYAFLSFLHDHYGDAVISALHRSKEQGLASVSEVLAGTGVTEQEALHAWAASTALDGPLARSASAPAYLRSRYGTASLDTTVDWDSPFAYAAPGVPANGSDFVRLRDAAGHYLSTAQVKSGVAFTGRANGQWSVELAQAGDGTTSGTIDSGGTPGLDESLSRTVTVPAADPTLSFDSLLQVPDGYAIGAVQVSTDGGRTKVSVANEHTVAKADPSAPGGSARLDAVAPGLTGATDEPRQETYDLSRWAGRTVLLTFRYVSATDLDLVGWRISDITLGGTVIADGTSLDGFDSTSAAPLPAGTGFSVQLVGYSSTTGKVGRIAVPLTAGLRGSLSGARVRGAFSAQVDTVAAIVTYDDPSEQLRSPVRYALTANGVLQPGG